MTSTVPELAVAILAGGFGSRLRPLVADRPKPLAEVNRRPFLAYLLDQLLAWGVREAVLCTGYEGDKVEAVFGSNYRGLRIVYSREAQPLGTGGALRLALHRISGDEILVMNGDSYCDTDLTHFRAWHDARHSRASLVLTRLPDVGRYGAVDVEEGGRIRSFREKAAGGGAGWINAGIYLIRRERVEAIPSGRAVSLEREMFPEWLPQGLFGFPQGGRFIDIGIPEDYRAAQGFFAGD